MGDSCRLSHCLFTNYLGLPSCLYVLLCYHYPLVWYSSSHAKVLTRRNVLRVMAGLSIRRRDTSSGTYSVLLMTDELFVLPPISPNLFLMDVCVCPLIFPGRESHEWCAMVSSHLRFSPARRDILPGNYSCGLKTREMWLVTFRSVELEAYNRKMGPINSLSAILSTIFHWLLQKLP